MECDKGASAWIFALVINCEGQLPTLPCPSRQEQAVLTSQPSSVGVIDVLLIELNNSFSRHQGCYRDTPAGIAAPCAPPSLLAGPHNITGAAAEGCESKGI